MKTNSHDPVHNPQSDLGGLSKIEYFSAVAMHGLLSNHKCPSEAYDFTAGEAFKYAEALMLKLNAVQEEE